MADFLEPTARRAVELSQAEAQRAGSPYTGAEHLILGILSLEPDAVPRSLRAAGLSRSAARGAIARFTGIEQEPFADPPPLSARCRLALDRARQRARERRDAAADVDDLLWAILDEAVMGAGFRRLLSELGLEPEQASRVRDELGARRSAGGLSPDG